MIQLRGRAWYGRVGGVRWAAGRDKRAGSGVWLIGVTENGCMGESANMRAWCEAGIEVVCGRGRIVRVCVGGRIMRCECDVQ